MHEDELDAASADTVQPGEVPPADDELAGLRRQLEETEAALLGLRDAQLRERAELENQRRRLQRDQEQARRFANEKLLRELLPVCDALDRGLASQPATVEGLREGLALTLKSLLKILQDHGLQRIDPEGEAFDPEFHEALSMVEPAIGQASNIVVTVVESGYVLNDRLLRPARVIVTRDA